ncbi:MAG: ABC transporter ATP-binding protein [Candidatus Heteroscillospira sp.]|jgi:ATP-binding cassette subfamily B protein
MEQHNYTTRELIGRFLPYYGRHKLVLFTDLFCAALTTVCDIVLPLIISSITNTAQRDFASLTVGFIGRLALLYLCLRIVDCTAGYYMSNRGHVMGAAIETDMRRDAYAHLQQLSNTYFNNTKVGQIMGRITSDLFDVTEFAHHCPEEFFIAAVKGTAAFVILSRINLLLTLAIFAMIPIMLVTCVTVNRRMRSAFRRQRQQIGELNARIEDSLLGQKVVKAFTGEDTEIDRFEADNSAFLAIKRETYRYMAQFNTLTKAFDGAMYLLVVLLGGVMTVKGRISAGDLVAYVMYVSTLITTIRRIIEFAEQFQRGITGIERFLGIVDADIEIFDSPDAVELRDPRGDITFDNVSFEYSDDHNEVFRNLDLHIKAGEKVAIVGPSGGGKTTLCNLIPRFYDVSSGAVSLDGRDVREYTLRSLRSAIGIVQQDVYLFSGTVYENIAYGRKGASREEVMEAAKKAGAHEFISALRSGYDTYVGERGVKLSGGQKQRISIARVFLKNPPIIILDEATSALDNESEYEVSRALAALSKGRTTITIAHRLSTIRSADRILVLTEDGIAEEGTHEELLERRGVYYRLNKTAEALN